MDGVMYELVLVGRTELLMHHDNIEVYDLIEEERKELKKAKTSKAGDDRSPAHTWLASLYHDGRHISMPRDNVQAMLRVAGARVIMNKQTSFKALTQSGITIMGPQEKGTPPDLLHCRFTVGGRQVPVAPLLDLRGVPKFADHVKAVQKMGFRLHVKRAPVGQAKHVRVRPIFKDWQVQATLAVTAPELEEDKLREILAVGGRVAGLGDWRPGSPKTPGPYGQFEFRLKRI